MSQAGKQRGAEQLVVIIRAKAACGGQRQGEIENTRAGRDGCPAAVAYKDRPPFGVEHAAGLLKVSQVGIFAGHNDGLLLPPHLPLRLPAGDGALQ